MGLPPPDPRSVCPLPSTEFVEPPTNKIPGYATAHVQIFSLCPQADIFRLNKEASTLFFDFVLPFNTP